MAGMPSAQLLDAAQLAALVARASVLAGAGRRAVLGIAGAPGAGKTTLAEQLVEALRAQPPGGLGPAVVAHLPMDGFHLADVQLDRLGLLDRKGAPETFDAHGYRATLDRILADDGHTVFVPGFERQLEQPLAAAIAIEPGVRLVVTEGNYLLLDEEPWSQVHERFAEVWFVDLTEAERLRRLVARHVRFGKAPAAAQAWALGPDQANADRIATSRIRADLVITPPD
jgi:pantothenate kinase